MLGLAPEPEISRLGLQVARDYIPTLKPYLVDELNPFSLCA
jgi:hypothetical protein